MSADRNKNVLKSTFDYITSKNTAIFTNHSAETSINLKSYNYELCPLTYTD